MKHSEKIGQLEVKELDKLMDEIIKENNLNFDDYEYDDFYSILREKLSNKLKEKYNIDW